MKELFLNNYMDMIKKNNPTFSKDELDKMKYGIEGIYLTITKLFVILLLGFIFNILYEIILLLVFYNFLRFFGFGYHARNSLECLIISISLFFILPLLVSKQLLTFNYKWLLVSLCIINFLLFAPSDTKKRPMINKKKKRIRKTFVILITIIYSIIIPFVDYKLSSILLLSIVIQTIMVNPFIYMIFKQPYNNYKNFINSD